jgi:predicted DNA-binding transcriptional regulator AlpA
MEGRPRRKQVKASKAEIVWATLDILLKSLSATEDISFRISLCDRILKLLAELDDTNAECLWTVEDVSAYCRTKCSTIFAWVSSGKIPHCKLSGGALRFIPSDIRKHVLSKKVQVHDVYR